jgi:hypothetical protein
VIFDTANNLKIAAEFKPPGQTKREYLTGLGQAIAYSRNFNYSLLVLPTVSDDGYKISAHIVDVMRQPELGTIPVGILEYDPAVLSPATPQFDEVHFFAARAAAPADPAAVDQSFYAKWREISAVEALAFLSHSYDEMRNPSPGPGNVRDRAFDKLWLDIQAGKLTHWGGGIRHYKNTPNNKVAVFKNYRNFIYHLGWCEPSGALTAEGLRALHVGTLYGPTSRPFLDEVAKATLTAGKHLILFNAISEYQDGLGAPFPDEGPWLDGLEDFLTAKGLLKQNPGRAAAAVAGSARQFLKAEKQFWRNLELIIPRGARVFHPGRGLIFNWSRITDLLQTL